MRSNADRDGLFPSRGCLDGQGGGVGRPAQHSPIQRIPAGSRDVFERRRSWRAARLHRRNCVKRSGTPGTSAPSRSPTTFWWSTWNSRRPRRCRWRWLRWTGHGASCTDEPRPEHRDCRCRGVLQSALTEGRVELEALRASLTKETKSTAGDKHETGRAMVQLDIEQAGEWLARTEAMEGLFRRLNGSTPTRSGTRRLGGDPAGALFYRHSPGSGDVARGSRLQAISADAPIAVALRGRTQGRRCPFGGRTGPSSRCTEVLCRAGQSLRPREQRVNHARRAGGCGPLPLRKIQRFGTITRNVRQAGARGQTRQEEEGEGAQEAGGQGQQADLGQP